MKGFTKEQIEDLLTNVLDTPKMCSWKGDTIQFCCTIHGESNPSCGINLDYCTHDEPNLHGQVFNCFSCGESGSIAWLVYKSLPDRFKSVSQAEKFLKQKYGVSTKLLNTPDEGVLIHRYEDKFIDVDKMADQQEVKPMSTLAPLKSGKQTYQYFFERGFDREDMKKYMIGRDLVEKTVTIPIFWENKKLAGVIGRYIDPKRPKNSRFKIYDFKRSSLIYPLDKVEPVNDTLILVEACFDVIMLNKWGFPNAIATMTNKVSKEQARQIRDRCSKLIVLCDLDERGDLLMKTAKKYLGKDIQFLTPTYRPECGKDPCEWGELETVKVIHSATFLGMSKLPRL
jgi:DNA primase